MKELDQLPPQTTEERGLPLPQIRVLHALYQSKGPLTRSRLTARIGNKTAVVAGRAVGYSDPVKRAAFEQTKDGGGSPGNPCPSLLTRGYVEEIQLDIDGLTEMAISLTSAGIKAFEDLGDVDLPPLRD